MVYCLIIRFILLASKSLTTTVEKEFRPLTHVTLPHGYSYHNEARLATVVNTLPALITRLRSLPCLISERRNIWGPVAPVGCLKSKIECYWITVITKNPKRKPWRMANMSCKQHVLFWDIYTFLACVADRQNRRWFRDTFCCNAGYTFQANQTRLLAKGKETDGRGGHDWWSGESACVPPEWPRALGLIPPWYHMWVEFAVGSRLAPRFVFGFSSFPLF